MCPTACHSPTKGSPSISDSMNHAAASAPASSRIDSSSSCRSARGSRVVVLFPTTCKPCILRTLGRTSIRFHLMRWCGRAGSFSLRVVIGKLVALPLLFLALLGSLLLARPALAQEEDELKLLFEQSQVTT